VGFANRDKKSVQAITILIKLLKAYASANTKKGYSCNARKTTGYIIASSVIKVRYVPEAEVNLGVLNVGYRES